MRTGWEAERIVATAGSSWQGRVDRQDASSLVPLQRLALRGRKRPSWPLHLCAENTFFLPGRSPRSPTSGVKSGGGAGPARCGLLLKRTSSQTRGQQDRGAELGLLPSKRHGVGAGRKLQRTEEEPAYGRFVDHAALRRPMIWTSTSWMPCGRLVEQQLSRGLSAGIGFTIGILQVAPHRIASQRALSMRPRNRPGSKGAQGAPRLHVGAPEALFAY